MKFILASAAIALLMIGSASPGSAAGNKTGFASQTTQGSGGKTNTTANPNNQGQTTVSGPKGQVKQGNTTCNNCETNLPGRNR